jgi:hypothetical protein
MNNFAFNNGLDDFKHGIEAMTELTLSNSTESQRQRIYDLLIDDCGDYYSKALEGLVLELSRYVAWCGDVEPIKKALERLLLEGPDIEKHNRKKINSKGTKKAAKVRTESANVKHDAWRDRAAVIRSKNYKQTKLQIAEKISLEFKHTENKGAAETIRKII